MEESTFDLVAASLRADTADLAAFVEALAEKLAGSFPGHARVERRRSLLRGTGPVHRLAVSLGDDRYELEHDAGRVVCRCTAVVRGIALRSDELELDDWIGRLSRALVTEAEATERGREALGRLLS